MDAILNEEEVRALTGYAKPSAQLRELHRQGFYRARRARLAGRIILERAHFDAVCRGVIGVPESRPRPKLMPA
jgi:hypothetical protein